MPGPQAPKIALADSERQELEKLVKRHSVAQQIALRARIVLAAAGGESNSAIARTEQVTLDTVRLWRQRWIALHGLTLADLSVAERLADLPRPGAPARLTADQICQIVALACETPAASERPISHWTGRELADELVARGIVEQISPRHARRLLKTGRPTTALDPLLADLGSR